MSEFSPRCDLADHIFSIGCKGTTDEMSDNEKFEIFKKRTNGVIHMSLPYKLTDFNIEEEVERVNNPKILSFKEETKMISDKRCKNGYRQKKIRTYFYYGSEYKSLKDISYYAKIDIHFDDILDLVPFLGCVISLLASDTNDEYVCIAPKSYLENLRDNDPRWYEHSRHLYWSRIKEFIKDHVEMN